MSESLTYGFDSSLTHFGYAVCRWREGVPNWLAVGVIETQPDAVARKKSKTSDNRRRVEGIARALRGLVSRHGAPNLIAVEALALPMGQTSKVTVSALGRVRGLVDALVVEHELEAREFQAQALKVALTGDRSASKDAVTGALIRTYPQLGVLLGGLKKANREHAADACAAIHAALTQSHAAPTEEQ